MIARGYKLDHAPEKAYSYRRRYVQLVAQIELAVTKLNSLANLAPHVNNAKILNDFETALRMMESLLSALVKLPNFGFDVQHLGEAVPMVRRVEEKIEDTYQKFKSSIEDRGSFNHLLTRWQQETTPPSQGCYFCSRPFMKAYFQQTKVKVDGISVKVYGCHICVAELKSRKKIKVLYFVENGHPVHWTLTKGYTPMEQYWDLNRRKPSYRTPNIELSSESLGLADKD